MNLLVGVKNIQKWRASEKHFQERPRLPLPYAFSGAFHNRNHKIFAVVSTNGSTPAEPVSPFERIYSHHELLNALRDTDLALFWGGRGLSAILRQVLLSYPRRRVILGSYIWQLSTLPALLAITSGTANQLLARFSRAVTVMTNEQLVLARKKLPPDIPVIRFICGIDTRFYKTKSNHSDVPEMHRPLVNKLLTKPYVIMLGDQQRCNEDALKIVKRSDISLVRVCREEKTILWFNKNIQKYKLNDRLFIFRDISHVFLRFLLQHAFAYAGLVNSKWQPAGWTVACEALASGLPVVLYDGLVSREMRMMRAANTIVRSVPYRDICACQAELESLISQKSPTTTKHAMDFVSDKLDIETTSNHFVREVESLYR